MKEMRDHHWPHQTKVKMMQEESGTLPWMPTSWGRHLRKTHQWRMVSSPGGSSLLLHHVRVNGVAVVTQHHDPENGPWLSRCHDLPPPPRRRDVGFGMGPSPLHLMPKVLIHYSSVPRRPRTSLRTQLRREERGIEKGKSDAARGALGARGGDLLAGEDESFGTLESFGGEGGGARDPAGAALGDNGPPGVPRLFHLWEEDDRVESGSNRRAVGSRKRGVFFAKWSAHGRLPDGALIGVVRALSGGGFGRGGGLGRGGFGSASTDGLLLEPAVNIFIINYIIIWNWQ
jgi:hypothetical protein